MTNGTQNIPKHSLVNTYGLFAGSGFGISSPKVPETRHSAISHFGAQGLAIPGMGESNYY